MKAVILAAGKGTRMGELTNELPKPMLKVQGRPILEHILEGLLSVGLRDFCIITGYRADVIESHFGGGERWGAAFSYARQVVQDGTGKAPEMARDFVGSDSFLLTYGDILVKPETYQQMLARFGREEFDGLVTVTPARDEVIKGGMNFFDGEFCLKRIVEKPTASDVALFREQGWLQAGQPFWYNAGIYIFRPVVFEFTARLRKSPRGEYELTDAINEMVARGHRVAGLEVQGRWVDVRDPEVLLRLQEQQG
jgi:UDP-N-acetylglucosamine diphosphorylase / glucose-1-phosphate thymidylyltransferase / UDP-N-acetylgalactosamine diphosphorylase / glucosamine-1-phosphate N-acetyltransferase / galactosamine-1-phosphate N-acetyltransferase